MNSLIPLWIIGVPFIALLALSFSFKGSSAMGGSLPRLEPRSTHGAIDRSAPLFDPIAPGAPRRTV